MILTCSLPHPHDDQPHDFFIPLTTPQPSERAPDREEKEEEEDEKMGLRYNDYLPSTSKIYCCKTCKSHFADHEDIISRSFRGQHGKAFLFEQVVNVGSCEAVERNMTTGRHVVRDIYCRQCGVTVGWRYDKAYEASEKYKEGRFILEAELLSWAQ